MTNQIALLLIDVQNGFHAISLASLHGEFASVMITNIALEKVLGCDY